MVTAPYIDTWCFDVGVVICLEYLKKPVVSVNGMTTSAAVRPSTTYQAVKLPTGHCGTERYLHKKIWNKLVGPFACIVGLVDFNCWSHIQCTPLVGFCSKNAPFPLPLKTWSWWLFGIIVEVLDLITGTRIVCVFFNIAVIIWKLMVTFESLKPCLCIICPIIFYAILSNLYYHYYLIPPFVSRSSVEKLV